jgi:hypothetical protein
MMRTRLVLTIVAVLAVAVAGIPAAGSAAVAGKYTGALYSESGKVVKHSKVTFSVAGNRVRDFRARGGTKICTTITIYGGLSFSYYPLVFVVPSVKVAQNKFSIRYPVKKAGKTLATNKLKGRFAGKQVSGTLSQVGPGSCSASYRWRARLAP